MGLADEFERRLERLVEGFFSKAFRSDLEAAEIGRRLLRDQEGGKTISVGAVYVPNRYVIKLSPKDHERFEGLLPELRKEFSNLLKENARQRRWKLPGAIDISFEQSDNVKGGQFSITASHEGTVEPIAGENSYPKLVLAEGDEEWLLDTSEISIGRLSSNDVVIEPNVASSLVSRQHAKITRRGDDWWIVDLNSSNGTFVNGGLVGERRLSKGDRITIGSSELVFEEPG